MQSALSLSIAGPDYPAGPYQVGETILFDGSDSYDPNGGDIVDYQWVFYAPDRDEEVDDADFTAQYERSFQQTGIWDANLTVWDDEDQSEWKWFSFDVVQ